MFVTQCLERSLHRTRATPATSPRRIEAFGRAMGRPFAFSGNGGTAIDADAPSLIALAKQMEFGV